MEAVEAVKLKPCPMAVFPWLSEHRLRVADMLPNSRGSPTEFAAGCEDCDIFTNQCRTREEAIAAWNARAYESNPSEIGELREAVAAVRSKAHQMWPRYGNYAMEGASNNAMRSGIEADNRRVGADWALDALLTRIAQPENN